MLVAVLKYVVTMLPVAVGMYGQLGHGDHDKQTSPKLVSALADKLVYLVGCGNSHTVRMSKNYPVTCHTHKHEYM